MPPRGRALAATAVALLVPAAAAPAAEVRRATSDAGPEVRVTGAAGERNLLRVAQVGANVHVRDARHEVTPGPGCTSGGPRLVVCPAAGAVRVWIRASDGDDEVELGGLVTLPARVDAGTGDDAVLGGAAGDRLDGDPGDDRLDGRGGADVLNGGRDTDVADYAARTAGVDVTIGTGRGGRPGDDGEAGERDNVRPDVEVVSGGAGADALEGSRDGETLFGRDGEDTLRARGGDDLLEGGDGPDLLEGGTGRDAHRGGAGLDLVTYDGRRGGVKVDLGRIGRQGGPGERDTVAPDVERATGGAGDDVLRGDAGANVLKGGPGDDTLDGRPGRDELFAGAGADRVTARDALDAEEPDTADCGPGDDRLVRDAQDADAGCETRFAYLGPPAVVSDAPRDVLVDRRGLRITVRVGCPAPGVGACSIATQVVAVLGDRRRTAGRGSITVRREGERDQRLRLSRTVLRRLEDRGSVTLEVVARVREGGRGASDRRRMTLRLEDVQLG